MNNEQWEIFFVACAKILGDGKRLAVDSGSWCAWTTFGSLSTDIHYWSAGLPAQSDINSEFIGDNGVWGQPFLYRDLAHIIVPKEFFWESNAGGKYENGVKVQNISELSSELERKNIPHRLTDIVLEIKLY